VAVPHNLTEEEAALRLRSHFDKLQEQHGHQVQGFESEWEEKCLRCRFSTMGVNVKSTVTVEPSQVVIDTELPMIAMMFKGVIEQQIRSELSQALA
jgi:hypothetical protein